MAEQVHALKYVIDVVSSESKERLPHVIPALVNHLGGCSDILCGRTDGGSTADAQVHKLRIQTSSLLQSKDARSRWAAVVLTKTVVEAVIRHPEGWDFLQTIGPWIRGLLAILGKPGTGPTRMMVMVLLTRIFLLTKGRPTLAREITTPHLSTFITGCLSAVTKRDHESKSADPSSPFLETVLQCFIRLLPHHPAIFRPFNAQIRSLIAPLLAPTPSDFRNSALKQCQPPSGRVVSLSHRLHSLLPICAPKYGAAEEWKKCVHQILNHIKLTANVTFRAISGNQTQSLKDEEQLTEQPCGYIKDELSLSSWEGTPAGCERISGLIGLLAAYIDVAGTMAYQIPVKPIYELAERILSIIRPQSSKSEADGNLNHLISREERETLFMFFPIVQIATLDLLSKLLTRMSILAYGFAGDLFEQIAWTSQRSSMTKEMRVVLFRVAGQIIGLIGSSFGSESSTAVEILVKLACKELDMINDGPSSLSNGASKVAANRGLQYNADSFVSSSKSESTSRTFASVHLQASNLLRIAMVNIPASALSQVRQDIDRIAVLLQDQELQLASILNPSQSPHGMNMVPFLSNISGSHNVYAEALIHRRLGSALLRGPLDSDQTSIREGDIDDDRVLAPVNDFSLKFVDGSGSNGLQLHAKVIDTPATPEITPGINSQSEEREPTLKRARLDIKLPTIPDTDLPVSAESRMGAAGEVAAEAEGRNVKMTDAVDSDSDDSFEVPEIVVELDDSDDEATEE